MGDRLLSGFWMVIHPLVSCLPKFSSVILDGSVIEFELVNTL
jgi:hypothetical protein